MTKKFLNEEEYLELCKEFLIYFGKDLSKDEITLTDGDTGMIMNSKSPFYKNFGGRAICEIAEYVAKKMNKRITWID